MDAEKADDRCDWIEEGDIRELKERLGRNPTDWEVEELPRRCPEPAVIVYCWDHQLRLETE